MANSFLLPLFLPQMQCHVLSIEHELWKRTYQGTNPIAALQVVGYPKIAYLSQHQSLHLYDRDNNYFIE